MRVAKIRTWFLGFALLLLLGGCNPEHSPTGIGEDPAPPDLLLGRLLEPTGLLSCSPVPVTAASATIGRDGGVLAIGPHKLVIPRNALSETLTITARTVPGPVRAVEFEPHGLEFRHSASLTLSYSGCNTLGLLLPKRIAYVSSAFDILEYLVSLDDLMAKRVTGRLKHFSQYAVAW